ncbi:MAG: hypothetical protein CMJ67_06005, partial [Planctomycetaceae bacterium]|nr:hypothetical protein [Planctomycetaceae bacterium]
MSPARRRHRAKKGSRGPSPAEELDRLRDRIDQSEAGWSNAMLRRLGGVQRAASAGRDMTRAIQSIQRDLARLETARDARGAQRFE